MKTLTFALCLSLLCFACDKGTGEGGGGHGGGCGQPVPADPCDAGAVGAAFAPVCSQLPPWALRWMVTSNDVGTLRLGHTVTYASSSTLASWDATPGDASTAYHQVLKTLIEWDDNIGAPNSGTTHFIAALWYGEPGNEGGPAIFCTGPLAREAEVLSALPYLAPESPDGGP